MLAVVVIGGILTSTLLDQLVTPAVFYKFGKPIAERVIAEREAEKRAGERSTAPFVERDVPPFSEKLA